MRPSSRVRLLNAALVALAIGCTRAAHADTSLHGCANRAVRLNGNVVELVDTSTGAVLFSEATSGHTRIVVSSNCCVYAIIDSTGHIVVRRGESGTLVTSSNNTAPNSTVTFSSSWCGYAIITPGGSIFVYDADTQSLVSFTSSVTHHARVDFGPIGRLYAVIDSVSITVLDGHDGHIVATTSGTTPDSYVLWSPYCTQYAVITPGVGIKVIDAATGAIIGSTSQANDGDSVEWDPPCGFHFVHADAVPMAPPWTIALALAVGGAVLLRRRLRVHRA